MKLQVFFGNCFSFVQLVAKSQLTPHSCKMRVSGSLLSLLLFAAGAVQAASSWSFDQGTISVSSKKNADGVKEKCASLSPAKCLLQPIDC